MDIYSFFCYNKQKREVIRMNSVFETSTLRGLGQISRTKYKNLRNISHYHSDYELIHVERGSAEISVNEHLFKVSDRESVFVNSQDIHHIHAEEDTVVTVLKADRDLLDRIFAKRILASPHIGRGMGVEELLAAVSAEEARTDESPDVREMMLNCLAVRFFIGLLRNSPTVEPRGDTPDRRNTHEGYRELCRKIAVEYKTITFEEAARQMNFSEPHFSKVFHQTFGMTFTRYLNTVRIAAALGKLKEGRMSVTEIAGSCGFNTIRNFNRVFKSFTGYSPKNVPSDYVFLYSLQDGYGLDPTLNCTVVLDE